MPKGAAMKPVFSVVFRPDVPIDLNTFEAVMIQNPLGPCAAIRCSEVLETSFGFLQLHPLVGERSHALTLFVPPSDVLYMLRADRNEQFGFLPATATASALPDPIG
jgi:hypothetical protein